MGTKRAMAMLGVGVWMTAGACIPGLPGGGNGPGDGGEHGDSRSFERIATFPVFENNDDPTAETVAEIVDATPDGRTLVYTDGVQGRVGFVDISRPDRPRPQGTVAVDGSPTSVSVTGHVALVGVDTTDDLTSPSGHLAVIDTRSKTTVRTIDLGGQPDSVKVSPDGRYAAVVLENQRDEEVTVDGVEGGLPQTPPGELVVVDLHRGGPARWSTRSVDLTGLTAYAPGDPEPEFVDVDSENRAVVTLQENNHIAVVDLPTGRVTSDFDAGSVDLDGVDTVDDGVIDPSGSLEDVAREPDAVAWLPGGRLATANEGDLFGGSRGFTVFDRDGRVRYDSGNTVEQVAIRHGHFPQDRADNKGTEPEGVEYGRYGRDDLMFVGSERGNFVAVYDVGDGRSRDGNGRDQEPEFLQLLPTGMGPEGLLAIPSRDLFVATSETDAPPNGVRTTISIYGRTEGAPAYPEVVSADGPGGTPIPWSALSGLAADPRDGRSGGGSSSSGTTLHAVWDSYYDESRILTIDAGRTPAVVRGSRPITGGTGSYDPEGLAFAPDGTTWVGSEGDAADEAPNRLLQLDRDGAVVAEIGLPDEVLACRAASTNRGSLGAGFEGLAVAPAPGSGTDENSGRDEGGGSDRYVLHVAQQRGWDYTTPGCEDLDDDPAGADAGEPGWTRVWTYDPASGEWTHVPYELEPVPAGASWVGLSEITPLDGGRFGLIERDNLTGDHSRLKLLTGASLDGPVTRGAKHRFDLLPPLRASGGWITDKPEGMTVGRDGRVYVVTDNDGVEDWTGETQLLRLGRARDVFGRP
jgi:hypothetical protein